MAVVTVEFEVGLPRRDAILRVYNQVYSNQDFLPAGLGAGPALVRPMGIDDVPVMTVTLWQNDPHTGATELAQVATTLEAELKRVPGTRDVYTVGAPTRAVLVALDAARLNAYGLTVEDLGAALLATNSVAEAGERVRNGQVVPLTVGTYLADADEVQQLVIGLQAGKPVYLANVAEIRSGGDIPTQYVWHMAAATAAHAGISPAVTLAISKQPGRNAADITRAINARLQALQNVLIPADVHVEVTRDYGATANEKANQLMNKLLFATLSVIGLVLFALGRREALVVGIAVVLTLAMTLAASYFMGFTINRVSLFALIFSIGILVDDAIVIVENIHRHRSLHNLPLREAIPLAVDEVGGPTILATFTVIAALLPMAFVQGFLGPYMRPIPINASAGMLLSLVVALVVTPWLALRLLDGTQGGAHAQEGEAAEGRVDRVAVFFEGLLRPFVSGQHARRRRHLVYAGIAVAMLLSVALPVLQVVVMKMMPFDNKNEFQVVVDLPEGTALEDTNALLGTLANELMKVPEVIDVQGYAGTAAPVNFNGLVRQYYLRASANQGDLQVNLSPKADRSRASHAIARSVRPALARIASDWNASLKVVEVPPGPPVLSPLVAEVYGMDADKVRRIALALAEIFRRTPGLVDIDTSIESSAPRQVLLVDRNRAARLGVSQAELAATLRTAITGRDVTYLHDGQARHAIPIRLRMPNGDTAYLEQLLGLRVRAAGGALVPLSELVSVQNASWQQAAYHKDMAPLAYVFADEAGEFDSPLYGMFAVADTVERTLIEGEHLQQFYTQAPADNLSYGIKWDGEWQVTYETFRDMGLAYAFGLVLIYLLIVAQFRSYAMPLLIMAPIPLTAIGVLPGHALLGAQFAATSMIGMIALGGILVRNSILLVDFIQHARAQGQSLDDAVVAACAVRARPIALTALAAALGALFILNDPVFNGLAVSLIFGLITSTVLTLIVVPLLYFGWQQRLASA